MIDHDHLTPVSRLFDMKLMHNAVNDGREQDAHDGDEDQAAKQRVRRSE